jgi:hypothetical protein
MAKEDSANWPDLKKILDETDKRELITLIRDLYKRSADDRRFITARYMDAMSGDLKGQMLEKYRKIIVNEFFPERGEGKLRYSVAKKAISDYSKASRDPKGTLDLMFTYVENGIKYTNTYGDIDKQFYLNIYGMLSKICDFLWEKKELYPLFRKRVFKICRDSRNIGWGFREMVSDTVINLKANIEDDGKEFGELEESGETKESGK